MDIREICKNILPVDKAAAAESQRRWNSIAKPLHSLGKLEDAIIKIAGITGHYAPGEKRLNYHVRG